MNRRTELPPLRWLAVLAPLLGAFVYAPLAFGATTPETSAMVDRLLLHSFLVWICVLILERRVHVPPLWAGVPLVLLAILGMAQVLNPRSEFNPAFADFIANGSHRTGWPGSVDAAATLEVLTHFKCLALGGWVMSDALASSRNRWLLFRTVALTGMIVAFIGIYQKAAGSETMLWSSRNLSEENFFAAYRYHGNAATFLYLSWPAALAVWLRSRLLAPGSVESSLDFCVFFFTLAALFVNTSKAGQVIGLIGVVWAAWTFRSELSARENSRAASILLGFVFLVVFAVFLAPALFSIREQWDKLTDQGDSLKMRWYAYGACFSAIGEGGLFGTGAGTFRMVFPFHTNYLEDRIYGYWIFAHQDYLQGIIEWGWVGSSLWVTFYCGALVRLVVRRRDAFRRNRREIPATVALIALSMVLLHAMVDFPLQIASLQLLVTFYLALAWSDPDKRARSQTPEQEPLASDGNAVRERPVEAGSV